MDPSQILYIMALIVPVVTGVIVTWRGLKEYYFQGVQKRFEVFVNMRLRFNGNDHFNEINKLLEFDDPKLASIPFENKLDYLGFFQELDLILNSGLARKHVAFYMFGYYSRICYKSQYFWEGLRTDSRYWAVFRHFAEQSIQFDKAFENVVKGYQEKRDYEEKVFRYIQKKFRI